MGTWGAGNFDDDHALNFTDALFDDLIKTVVCGLSDDAYLCNPYAAIAALDILTLFAERLDRSFEFGPETVAQWRDAYIKLVATEGEVATDEVCACFDHFEAYMHNHQY